jgi:tetratricopeptide (TPR) repeat protein
VLDSFLRLLGVPGRQIPHDQADRAALYRRRLAGRRTLLVLDNAASEQQVRPLLPGGPGCLTLITSRRRLPGLGGATHLPVGVFTPEEAVEFLDRAAPGIPTGEDPDALLRIADRCGHLPLALGLVAGQMRGKPGWTRTDHADRLDQRHRQRRLEHGVELALDLSSRDLPAPRRRLLRLLALHPGHDLDAYAAAALAGIDPETAADHLRHLSGDHLLQQSVPGRFTFHDLVRAYAADRAADEDRPAERRAALTRLFDSYLATAGAAMDTLYPAEAHCRPRITAPATRTPVLANSGAAVAWLDAERPNLVAVATHAARHGWPAHTVQFSITLYRYFDGGFHSDALTVHSHARDAARQTGNRGGEARVLNKLGITHTRLAQYAEAAACHEQAVALARLAGDRSTEAAALDDLGLTYRIRNQYEPAGDHHRRALVLCRQIGDPLGEAYAVGNLGVIDDMLGRFGPAADHYRRSLALHRQTGHRNGEAAVLNNLGGLEEQLGHYESAADYYRQALVLFRQLGNAAGEGLVLDNLGVIHTLLGQPEQATRHHLEALRLCRESGNRLREAATLNGLGNAAHAAGDHTGARGYHSEALTIAGAIGVRAEQAQAHAGLGHAHRALGEFGSAREHYAQALAVYEDLGSPAADGVRTHLNALPALSDDRRSSSRTT